MIRAGVLSDTHLHHPTPWFSRQLSHCFRDCELLIHAGDITGLATLELLSRQPLQAVAGNMCEAAVKRRLPQQLLFTLGRFTIGLTHGANLGPDPEDRLWSLFPEADCIISGHTHLPSCRTLGPMLFVNPGSFQPESRYGGPGSYLILEAGEELKVTLCSLAEQP